MQHTCFITLLDSVDSTNNCAMAAIHAGMAQHGMAWMANEQTAGKGQRGRHWVSEKGQNVILSILVKPFGLSVHQQFLLSAAVAVGSYDFFNKYAGLGTAIKWPNDLYWGDKKAGGILIENVLKGSEWSWSVIGIGININQINFLNNINGVSLKQITSIHYNIAQMGRELYGCIMDCLETLNQDQKYNIIEKYNTYLYKKGQSVTLKKDNIRFNTVVQSVNEQGQLITLDAMERVFNWGEVEWVL